MLLLVDGPAMGGRAEEEADEADEAAAVCLLLSSLRARLFGAPDSTSPCTSSTSSSSIFTRTRFRFEAATGGLLLMAEGEKGREGGDGRASSLWSSDSSGAGGGIE
jgi:hypothetical protein